MAVKLPATFVERMKIQLGEQFAAFIASYDQARHYGLRVNPLKLEATTFVEQFSPFLLRPISWADDAFYFSESDRPGRHPYYHAGLYYIQEPSAMAPAECLDVQPGDRVLDLCAAPGGKSTQIAAKLRGQGLLVSNDQSAERTKALVKNLELFGVQNTIVLNESPHRMSRLLPAFFNKILVDAPCSGEGMFRKDEHMWREWSESSVAKCSQMQTEILRHAAAMLAPGGRLVYSTCTFAIEENERIIIEFLRSHPEFETLTSQKVTGFSPGDQSIPELSVDEREQLSRTVRLYPHLLDGEGHFVAVLKKRAQEVKHDEQLPVERVYKPRNGKIAPAIPNLQEMYQFFDEQTNLDVRGAIWLTYAEHVYRSPQQAPDLAGLKVVRPGFYVGMIKKNRFEPSHSLALSMSADDAKCSLRLSLDDPRLLRYLRGETLNVELAELTFSGTDRTVSKQYVLVCVDGFALGWGKWQQAVLKNEYPQTWRRLT
jgi:NOL1/NOP2/sun family putative RNA methylase